jgi:hypothetical protein
MDIRTMGNWAITGSIVIAGMYAYRDIRKVGWTRALFEGSTSKPGSWEDLMGKAIATGGVLFLLTRLVPESVG